MGATETYLRLALKAQSQCRATLETLAAIKNPPVVYARQANVTTGPQQINNGNVTFPPAREDESKPNNNQRRPMSYYRTPEHRARKSAAIQGWRPWERSTGPKSAVGKATVARNAYKGGWRALLGELRQALREQDRSLNTRGG